MYISNVKKRNFFLSRFFLKKWRVRYFFRKNFKIKKEENQTFSPFPSSFPGTDARWSVRRMDISVHRDESSVR